MRADDLPSPYGFGVPSRLARNVSDDARRTAASMASASKGTSMTFAPRRRSAWRRPMFTAGTPNVGASSSPDDELPTMHRARRSRAR